MLKIGIIGAGYWGKNLIRNFYQLKCLSSVCDKNSDVLKNYYEKYPELKFTVQPEELLKDKAIDAIVIATPANSHFELAKKALLNHKHVFVEKPLAMSVMEGKELIELAEKNKKVLMVGHLLHYHNGVVKLKELIDAEVLGKIQYIYSTRLNIGKIRTEENILWSFAPHDISVIIMLLNKLPESVSATGGSYLQPKIPDVTLTSMNFSGGVKSHIFVSWLHPFKEQKMVVVGDKKMAVFDDLSNEKLSIYSYKVEWIERMPVATKAEPEIVQFEMEEPLKLECSHFIECILKNLKPQTDGYEALKVLQILETCQESLNNSGKTIRLKETSNTSRYFVHESSCVDEDVKIGEGTQIWHFSHILKGSRIGKNCKIGQNVVIGPNVTIGNGCKIQNNVSVYEGVILEDEVFCGPSCVFTNVINPRSAIPRMKELKPILVRKGATIGANVTIVCGHTIGKYAFIGAGAVVSRDVSDYALVYGNPGEVKGWMCECGVKLKFDGSKGICGECSKKYKKEDNRVEEIIQ